MYSRTRVCDRLPARQDADRRQHGREQHEQHRDAVDAHVVADARIAAASDVLDELEAGLGWDRSGTTASSDSTNTIRLVHSAVQRALEATVASSPRTDMMTRQPTSGSQVSSDSRGKPAAFMALTAEDQEDADQQHQADQHDEGIDRERAGLQLDHLGASRPCVERRDAVGHAVDDGPSPTCHSRRASANGRAARTARRRARRNTIC